MQHRRPNRVRSSAEVLAFDVRIETTVGQRARTGFIIEPFFLDRLRRQLRQGRRDSSRLRREFRRDQPKRLSTRMTMLGYSRSRKRRGAFVDTSRPRLIARIGKYVSDSANQSSRGVCVGVLDGRCAIVTGAARGIGRGIAFALGKEGARLVLVDLLEREVTAPPPTCERSKAKQRPLLEMWATNVWSTRPLP